MLERCRLESETAQLEVIGDHDDRTRVPINRTLAVPHRWICWVTIPKTDPGDHSFGAGSGVLISPRHVLTAAHVLVSEVDPGKAVGDRLRVQPARNGLHHPFEPVKVRGWQVDPRWIDKVAGRWHVQPQFDYGLITLDRDVSGWKDGGLGDCTLGYWGAPGRCGHGSEVGLTAAQVSGQTAQVTGYPGKKAEGTLWTGSGAINFDRRLNVLAHTIDTTPGQSGAPVWFMRNKVPCLVGIHSRAGTLQVGARTRYLDNIAVLLTPDLLRQVETWKRTFAR